MCTAREQELIDYIQSRLVKDDSIAIAPTTLLFKERLLNSMNILDMIGYVEARVGRKLTTPEIVMANFQSVRDIVRAFLE